MQFKHPEILYFLAFLILPILVHLFQLQKFVKTPFTNVAFLKKIVLQTRKSSQIKKWLLLLIRLLLLAAIIIAFAQPYFSNTKNTKKLHYLVYLDNSLSMNTLGNQGDLFQSSVKEIIENTSKNHTFSLLTNSDFYENLSTEEFKDKLVSAQLSANQIPLENVVLQFNQLQKSEEFNFETVLISDFQNSSKAIENKTKTRVVRLSPTSKENIAIDSVSISNIDASSSTLHVVLKNNGKNKENVSVAIFNDKQLLGRQTLDLDQPKHTLDFLLQNTANINGRVEITYSDAYDFDNTFYFNLNTATKINVLAIGNTTSYLSKIYTKNEFNFIENTEKNINYNAIPKQDLILIDNLKTLNSTLIKSLTSYVKKGGYLAIIPSVKANITEYNALLNMLNIGKIENVKNDSLKITSIQFKHPLFKNVFHKEIRNFQYPTVNHYFPSKLKNTSAILKYENQQAFISQIPVKGGAVFWFSSSIKKTESNFKSSPIIVPIFYKIGKQSFKHSQLFYRLHKRNTIAIKNTFDKNSVITMVNATSRFIPLQRSFPNKMEITTTDSPTKTGIYNLLLKKDTLKTVAFNVQKKESFLPKPNFKEIFKSDKDIVFYKSVSQVFKEIKKNNEVTWLWKWFLILAIVSLCLEILILKFFKP